MKLFTFLPVLAVMATFGQQAVADVYSDSYEAELEGASEPDAACVTIFDDAMVTAYNTIYADEDATLIDVEVDDVAPEVIFQTKKLGGATVLKSITAILGFNFRWVGIYDYTCNWCRPALKASLLRAATPSKSTKGIKVMQDLHRAFELEFMALLVDSDCAAFDGVTDVSVTFNGPVLSTEK